VVTLGRGESTFLELNTNDFEIGAGGHIQLRVVVNVFPPGPPDRIALPPDPCVPTFEVINKRTAEQQSRYPPCRLFSGIHPPPTPD